jgi:hypothetical protein
VDIPDHLVGKVHKFSFTALSYPRPSGGGHVEPSKIKIGSGTFTGIKLNIKSNPVGAETFLIPNRVWINSFQNEDLQNWKDRLYNYRVNTSYTNTFAYIDETTYAIVFKQGRDYRVIKHFTKPKNVEKEQTVFVDLNK